MRIIYDCETYKNVFTLAAEHADYPIRWQFEISPWRDDSRNIVEWCQWLASKNAQMVGFNNVGFDYPVLHTLLQMGKATPEILYQKATSIIGAQETNRFANIVYPSDRYVEQIDLFKIAHFDNKARATSLKALEFVMRMGNIEDLPFPVGTSLTRDQIEVLKKYNRHDVTATKKFYHEMKEQIDFRTALTQKHGRDFMNHNDVKIGKEIFQMELEKAGVQCYKYGPNGREPMQTKRPFIALKDCIPSFIKFNNPEFNRIKDYLQSQVVSETKGVFKDLTASVGGLDFVFGTGGIHASVENQIFEANDDWMILDVDVTSLYPSIAIEQGYYPEHLGPTFVDIYRKLREQRVSYKKGTAENAMLKLALNGTYGASNDQFSVFYDPQFTMKITLSGQMMIAMLAERLLTIDGLKIIQANTDGITVYVTRNRQNLVTEVCAEWEKLTKLTLESVEYSKMIIADVNSYIAVKTDGSTKRKGRYEWDLDWHQNHSALVIPKVAEQVLVHGKPIRETVENWPDKMDFMLRVKVPRTSHLLWGEDKVQNMCRYYVSTEGRPLTKVMPPLAKKPDQWRRIGVESGWKVQVCNDLDHATAPIDFEYYIREIEKLTLGMK
jgi:DNA polymerase elongation subunit (family B)